MSDRSRASKRRTVSAATLTRYRLDAERVRAAAENAGKISAEMSLADALLRPDLKEWFAEDFSATVTPATWRRYRRALAVVAQDLGSPDAAQWARLTASAPSGRQRRRLDRPAGEGIRVAELRALRLQLQRSGDANAQLAVDLIYACAATGLEPEDYRHVQAQGSGVHQLLVMGIADGARAQRIGLLLPWLRERVLAVVEAARSEQWRECVGAVRALLRNCGAGRVRRGQGYLTLESAVAQYALDAAAHQSTASTASPRPKPASRPTRERGRATIARTTVSECLAQAEAVVRRHPPGELSSGTAKEYWRETWRLMRAGDPALIWMAVADSLRPNVVRKRRAALHSTYRRMAWLLVHGARAGQLGDSERQGTMRLWPLLHAVMQAEPAGERLMPPQAERKPRRSQRGLLVELPRQWQLSLIKAVPATIRTAVLVQAVTGCRPEELARGVRVDVDDHHLVIEIFGAKVSGHAGWTRRTLRWSRATWNPLLAELRSMGSQTVRLGLTKKAYYQGVSRSAARLWPHLSRPLAPYALRHAIASTAKRERGRGDYVAHLLGHRSVRTQSTYGLWQLGSGTAGVLPDSVEVHAPEPPPPPPGNASQLSAAPPPAPEPPSPNQASMASTVEDAPEIAESADAEGEFEVQDEMYDDEQASDEFESREDDEQESGEDYPAPGM